MWGYNFHIFEPQKPYEDDLYDAEVVCNQIRYFGPFPRGYDDLATDEQKIALTWTMDHVASNSLKPFRLLSPREISDPDKKFIVKIMKMDPRDRPTAQMLLDDEWFTETSARTVCWYEREDWNKLQSKSAKE